MQHVVVFVNKTDVADPELLDLVALEVAELLRAQGYENAPFVMGSALKAMEAAVRGDALGSETACIRELVAALDRHIPDPDRDLDAPFLMPIEGVMSISGRGTVVTGRVDRGVLPVGATVEIVGLHDEDDAPRPVVVTGIQTFRRDLKEARAGENVGLLLRGVKRDEVVRGQVVSVPGTVQPHTVGEADLYVLAAEEGGRHTAFGSGYSPQFFFGTTDVTSVIEVAAGEGDGRVHPGGRSRVVCRLQRPVGLEPGMRFAIREGRRTVGAGRVTRLRGC